MVGGWVCVWVGFCVGGLVYEGGLVCGLVGVRVCWFLGEWVGARGCVGVWVGVVLVFWRGVFP